jgi:acyl-coenzyme A synthetase/AMP-(fatty) acid ligase
MYGSTEIGPIAAGAAAAMPDLDGATGFLLPDIDVQAIDERGAVLAPGRVGRLRMRGPGMAREYWHDPEATARQFAGGWFYPNDVGAVTQDRTLVIQGRADDLINVGGSKFAPEAFEEVLLRVPGVVDAAAFGVPDALGKHRVHAAIVTRGEVELAAIEAAFRSARRVPAPEVVLRVPALPRTAQGKLNRAALANYVLTVVDSRVPPGS